MNKWIYKLIICVYCLIFVTMLISSNVISCSTHIWECNIKECNECLFIHKAQEILKGIFIITCIKIMLINIKIINKIVMFIKNIIYTNPVLMKVKLNE